MRVPLSWLQEFVEITMPLPQLAHRLTMAGLEVEAIQIVGLPWPQPPDPQAERGHEVKIEGLSWDPEKIVTAAVYEVMPHPNADRLVLCRLFDGQAEHIVLTGAPNLFPYKGIGPLAEPLKVAYAREGARLYDGHQPGWVLTTLKRARIRGFDSYSMICSEKELGISEDHEGVIVLDPDAPVGVPLAEYMGDAVLEIALTPNLARCASVIGVAREVAALTDQPLRLPPETLRMEGPPIEGMAAIRIEEPPLNPRFVLGLIQGVTVAPSPYKVQLRLKLAGMRPINNIVDATNYVMLELGEPLHAFDYEVLRRRAGGEAPTIITRRARPGERLTTLDGVERTLDEFTVLVCDTAGPLSIAGVMGGAESEVSETTRAVLLEGASWNFINIRRTVSAQKLLSEAAYRFSRGVHPALAERGVRRCLDLMQRWAGGVVAQGLVDAYPLPPRDPVVEVTPQDVRRWLGLDLSPNEIAALLERLEFKTEIAGEVVHAQTPDHRLDIGEGIVGMADLMEEIARLYGYERIPETRLSDELPPPHENPALEAEERLRDILVNLGLQEVVTHRLTSPQREGRTLPPGLAPQEDEYLRLANPIAADRVVMRRNLLASLLEIAERNARLRSRLTLFEIGPVFLPQAGETLPREQLRLAILLSGERTPPSWQGGGSGLMDFYDLKGLLEALLGDLHIRGSRYEAMEHPTFHPGKCAQLWVGERPIGVLGELHPLVKANYDLSPTPVLAADLDVEALFACLPPRYEVSPVPAFPPVLEDLAVVVDEDLPAERVAQVIREAAGSALAELRLFDVYRGPQVGPGKKSLAYSLAYQSWERTLTDEEAARIRQRIIRQLEKELGAHLRA